MEEGVASGGVLEAWRDRAAGALVIAAALAATGWLLRPVESAAWLAITRGKPAMDAQGVGGAVGQGVAAGLLGGFRALAADFLWLKASAGWEDNDLPATQTLIKSVTAIDPRPLYFWINGARMIAYDMPHWRIAQAGGFDAVPSVVRRRIDEEQARVALALLAEARRVHPASPAVLIEIADIHLRRLGDVATAADYYGLATAMPGAPHYAARVQAALLRMLGRPREALDRLVRLHPTLPADDPEAMPGIVLARIRELEDELGVPVDARYSPARQ